MGIFDKQLNEEEKEQAKQLNNISLINMLNTHNSELHQKVIILNAENDKLRRALAHIQLAVQDILRPVPFQEENDEQGT